MPIKRYRKGVKANQILLSTHNFEQRYGLRRQNTLTISPSVSGSPLGVSVHCSREPEDADASRRDSADPFSCDRQPSYDL